MPADVETMMYVGEIPWHGLGTKLEQEATAAEAIKAGGLDWEVELQEIVTKGGILLPNKRAVIRMDKKISLGVVGTKYKVVQNAEAFSFFDNVVGQDQAIYHTAGSLGKGERVWILAKLPSTMAVAKDDEVDKYLLFANGHDGKFSISMFFTPIRVVCHNTLNIALQNVKQGISIRHVGNISGKIKSAQDALGFAETFYHDFEERAKYLASLSADSEKVDKFIQTCFHDYKEKDKSGNPIQKNINMRNQVRENFEEEGKKIPAIAGTFWALFNGYTGFIDHQRSTKGSSDEDRKSNKLHSIWFGNSSKMKQRGWDAIVKLTS